MNFERENMFLHKNDYLFSDDMLPVRKQQAFEDFLRLEKEFAALIYAQRYLDKYPKVYYNGKKKKENR